MKKTCTAQCTALYFDAKHHAELVPEFKEELATYGRIYMYRLRPDYEMRARAIEEYPGECEQAKQ
jgi:urocanate hydratase